MGGGNEKSEISHFDLHNPISNFPHQVLGSLKILFLTLFIVLGIQAFWALPFLTYVKTNTQSLRGSYINRDITTQTIENEAKHNTALNSIRYYASWIDTQEDRNTYTFTYRDWYKNNTLGQVLSFFPALFAILGIYFLVGKFRSKQDNLLNKGLLILPLMAFLGWFAIKGINSPFGFVYSSLQDNFPVIAQVFRWQSSKIWPFLAMTIPILATIGVISFRKFLGEFKKSSEISKHQRHAEFISASQAKPGEARSRNEFGMTTNEVRDDNSGDTLVSFSISRSGLYRFSSIIATLFVNLFFRILIVAVILGLLVYIYPYFKGGLIREKSFVKVPEEYFELSGFLSKNDKFSRIYLAPESNTLYFRSYSWGFWGSVVLNYLIPNPIIEKALVIGSKESEEAFRILTSAYYSEDPKTFISALKLYDTRFILSDENAARGNVGYPYNWELHKKMIYENPELEMIWQKGNLSLYRLNQSENVSLERLSGQNDPGRLNMILSPLINNYGYFISGTENGSIYPFALKYDNINFGAREILLDSKYKGKDGIYNLSINENDLQNSPVGVYLNETNKELLFYPLFPVLKINDKQYSYEVPIKKYILKEKPIFVSVDDKVLDFKLSNTSALDTFYYQISTSGASIKTWGEAHQTINVLPKDNSSLFSCNSSEQVDNFIVNKDKKVKCATKDLSINKDAIVRLDVAFESTNPIRVLLCVKSNYKQRCLNRNTATFVKGQTKVSTIIVPEVFQQNDQIKIFLDFDIPPQQETYDSIVSIKKLDLIAYESIEEPKFGDEKTVLSSQNLIVPLKTDDQISFAIPVFEGADNWTLKREDIFMPEASISSFGEKEKPFSGKILMNKDNSLEIVNMESNGGIYPRLDVLNPRGGIGFIAFSAENISGIPAKIFVREENQDNRLWEDQIKTKNNSEIFDLFLMPNEAKTYYLEISSTALGPRVSRNIINNLVFQVIPRSWYGLSLSLNPVYKEELKLKEKSNKETNTYTGDISNTYSLITIPTAFSPFWKLDISGTGGSRPATGVSRRAPTSVLINGWKQGWEVSPDAVNGKVVAKATFFPNVLAYIGFLPLVVILGWVIIKGFKLLVKRLR